jgi:hypothetical protein
LENFFYSCIHFHSKRIHLPRILEITSFFSIYYAAAPPSYFSHFTYLLLVHLLDTSLTSLYLLLLPFLHTFSSIPPPDPAPSSASPLTLHMQLMHLHPASLQPPAPASSFSLTLHVLLMHLLSEPLFTLFTPLLHLHHQSHTLPSASRSEICRLHDVLETGSK